MIEFVVGVSLGYLVAFFQVLLLKKEKEKMKQRSQEALTLAEAKIKEVEDWQKKFYEIKREIVRESNSSIATRRKKESKG